MNKHMALLFLFLSLSAGAQELTCLDKLLHFSRHSGLHQVTRDEWSDGKEMMDPESVKGALAFLTNSKLLCKSNEVTIKVHPVCASLLPDLPHSNTCFVYTNVGFFVVSRDIGRNMNFIFSKDKRFSEP